MATLICLAGCREPFQILAAGQPPERSRASAEQLFAALGARVAHPVRDRKYDSARVRIAHAAFLPSRIWDDTTVWSAITPSRRTLFVNGRILGDHYSLEAARTLAPLPHLADSRHSINLTRLTSDEFSWDTDVSYAVGSITAPQLSAFARSLATSANGKNEGEVRASYKSTIPRASAVLGQLFRIDSVRTSRLEDKSTLAFLAVSLAPDGVDARYPNFARYTRRYAGTARMHLTLVDRAGGAYVDLALADGHMSARVRSLDGRLVPLSGAARPMPDSLALVGEVAMRVRRFTVGFRDYRADFTIIATGHERAWSIVSRTEPHWVLPLVGERLLRTPLRRPFQGSGALFRVGVRDDSTGGQTILHRRLHLEVQESLILRFIGRLGSIAISDFAGRVEKEQNAWLAEVLAALVADVREMGSGL